MVLPEISGDFLSESLGDPQGSWIGRSRRQRGAWPSSARALRAETWDLSMSRVFGFIYCNTVYNYIYITIHIIYIYIYDIHTYTHTYRYINTDLILESNIVFFTVGSMVKTEKCARRISKVSKTGVHRYY